MDGALLTTEKRGLGINRQQSEEGIVSAKILLWLLATVVLITAQTANAQQPSKIYRIGYLSARSDSNEGHRITAFRQGLQELGYTEGKNIVIELRRAAPGQRERLRELATELVRFKVDVIVASAGPTAQVAKELTTTIPIVFTVSAAPVETGLVQSLARPGRNVTGLSDLHSALVKLANGLNF